MDNTEAIAALAALAQTTRLDTFRLLVKREPGGIPAGELARNARRIFAIISTISIPTGPEDHIRMGGVILLRAISGKLVLAAMARRQAHQSDRLPPSCGPEPAAPRSGRRSLASAMRLARRSELPRPS